MALENSRFQFQLGLHQACFFNIFPKLNGEKTRKNSKLSQFFIKTKLVFFPKLKFPAIFEIWSLKLIKEKVFSPLKFTIFFKIEQNLSKNMKNSSYRFQNSNSRSQNSIFRQVYLRPPPHKR